MTDSDRSELKATLDEESRERRYETRILAISMAAAAALLIAALVLCLYLRSGA